MGPLYEDPFGPRSRFCRTTCGRLLSQDPCIKTLVDQLYQDPVGPLVQDLCIRLLFDWSCKPAVALNLHHFWQFGLQASMALSVSKPYIMAFLGQPDAAQC